MSTSLDPPQEILEILTERLLLRAFEEHDLAVWNRLLFADPDVIRFLPLNGPLEDDALHRALARSRAHWAEHAYGVWAVQDRATGAFAGHTGLRYLEDVGETEVYYAFARPFWGRGLATQAAGAAVEFGFDVAGLRRIVAYAVPENRASTRVMEKLGMRFEAETDIFGLHCARYAIHASGRGRPEGPAHVTPRA